MTKSNIFLVIAVAISLMISLFSVLRTFRTESHQSPAVSSWRADTLTSSKPIRIAYIIPDSILKNYVYYQEISKQFESKRSIAEREFEKKARTLQSEMQMFQQKAQAGLLSQNEMRAGEERLLKQERELQEYNQTETEKLMREEKELTEKLYNRVSDYIKKYNDTAQYDIILNYVPGTTIWFANSMYDITHQIVEGLNQAYQLEKEGKK
ncbi:MAG: OmpH family outer membrane protein [Cytophagales bacterium]|nr:OmpH family outer membrane protein [Cytophagales bacterium]MDW8384492.1 OmpH family outer membrane protein [Flammeovirgaceae bacterium]